MQGRPTSTSASVACSSVVAIALAGMRSPARAMARPKRSRSSAVAMAS